MFSIFSYITNGLYFSEMKVIFQISPPLHGSPPPPPQKKKKSTVPTPQPHFPFYYVTSFTQYLLRGAYYEGKEYEGPNYLLSSLIDIQPIYKHGLHNQLHNKLLKISNNF